jgi:hypothetical protein
MATRKSSRCPGCGAAHRFDDLEVVDVIGGEYLRGVVTAWPSGVVVEVRRCAECRATVARKVTLPGRVSVG